MALGRYWGRFERRWLLKIDRHVDTPEEVLFHVRSGKGLAFPRSPRYVVATEEEWEDAQTLGVPDGLSPICLGEASRS